MLAKKLMALGGYTKAEDLERDYPTMESFVEAFPQAQVLINQYKKQTGGGQQDPLTQVITAVAEQVGIDPQQLAGMLQQSPEFVTQLTQMAAQDPNQAAQALIQVLQNASQGQQAQAQQSELAQPGQMPMNPEEAMQMAYNGGSKLSKFIRKTGGDIAFPQAAPMYDDSVYRTFPPNIPRLFAEGGESEEESFGPVRTPGIPMESYAQAQGLPEVTSSQDYGSRLSSVKKNKSIGSTEGMTVSQIWTKVTGLPWSEAKKQGLTDGSYASNIALKKDLLKGVKVNKQAPKEEPFVRRSQTPAGRSAMVDNINEGYENRQGQRYIQANAPNRYTAPTQSAIDLYEAGQNYIERNAAGAPRNRYVAPTPEAVDLYAAGLNYLERNSAPSNRAVVNTPRNLPFSYFSNPNMARFLGRPQSGRVYQYGGDLPSFQGDQGPSETGQQYMPVQQIPQIEITDTRPRVLMPPQAQYAEVPWWAPLATMGAAGALMTGGLPIGQVKIGKAQQDAIANAEKRADSKDFKLSQTGDGPGTEKHYLEFTNKKLNDAIIRYNRDAGTRYKAFGDLPKDAQTQITKNLRTLYELKYNAKARKTFNKADRIMKMYPEKSISAGVSEHMSEKGAFGRTRRNIGSRFEGIPGGISRAGWGALGFGVAAGIPYAIDAFRDWLNGQQQTEEGAALQTNYATGTDSDQPVDAGTVYQNNAPAVNESLDNTEVIDSYGNIIDNKYGGNIYAYGGGTPFGYGYFAPPMAYGGNSNAMPGIDDVDAQLQMRNNTWLDYVRNNVKNAAMPQSFRKGGAKKKKGLIKYQQDIDSGMSGQTSGFIDMNSALADSQMISLERDIQRRFSPETFDPMGLTNYEIERESALYGAPTMSNPSDPNQGEIGPPKPDYVLDRELFDEQRANMPGSTAQYHYDDQGNYLLGQVPQKKKREKTELTDAERALRQQKREKGVNMFLGMGNRMLSALDEKRARERQDQIDQEIQRNRFTVAPTDRGYTMTNLGVPVPPTKQTPVQFTGYNPSVYAKRGAEMKTDYMYLSPSEIEEIIRLGGQVEFLD